MKNKKFAECCVTPKTVTGRQLQPAQLHGLVPQSRPGEPEREMNHIKSHLLLTIILI